MYALCSLALTFRIERQIKTNSDPKQNDLIKHLNYFFFLYTYSHFTMCIHRFETDNSLLTFLVIAQNCYINISSVLKVWAISQKFPHHR